MKQILPLLFFITVLSIENPGKVTAQTTISYEYDAAGNRTRRHVIILPYAKADTSGQTIKSKQETFEETLGGHKIIIYPNPTKGQMLVEIQGYTEETRVELYVFSLKGELLISKAPASGNTPFDLSAYPVGTYVLKVKLGDAVSKWKVIKQ
jgi:hypothetical protein